MKKSTIITISLLTVMALFSCKKSQEILVTAPKSEIYYLASPITLNIDTTEIILDDFFTNSKLIDSIEVAKQLELKKIEGNQKIQLIVKDNEQLPFLTTLDAWIDKIKYSILVKKSPKIHYTFEFEAAGTSYKEVKLMGEINAWNPNNNVLEYKNGKWQTQLTLEPGIYQYLLVIDGVQQLDPSNQQKVSNNMGGFNSVVKIGKENTSKQPYLYTKTFDEATLTIGSENKCKKIFVLWDNYLLPSSYVTKKDSLYRIRIPEQANNTERSYIRVWAYNDAGISNDLLIALSKGKVITDASILNRTDYHAAVIYNVFVDRFFDGNKANNSPINNPQIVHPKADYQGGDIKGISKFLQNGYFDTLGANTLWISPIVKNVEGAYGQWKKPLTKFSAYHGYWPISFTQIDEHFGTPNEFQQLVDLLHKNDKNLLLDFVAHHVHEKAPFYLQHKENVTPLYLPDGSLNTERWDDHRLTTWFDVFLPTIDNSNPVVANIISDSAVWWLKTYNIDGFRHDAAKHVPLSFWRLLTYKTKRQVEIAENRKIYQIGETYGTPELIGSYVSSGMLDAQFDFNLYDAISTSLAIGNSLKKVEQEITKSLKNYGWHNLMGNITGNQDRGRFISYAGGSLRFDENAKEAGWTRNIDVGNDNAYKKSAMLFAFISTVPGIPVVYYGDEIGMPGGNDPDNRRMMQFENLNHLQIELKNTAAKLLNLRRSNIALIFGDFRMLLVEDNLMVYQRTYFNKSAIVVFNNSDKEQKITIQMSNNCSHRNIEQNFGNAFEIDCRKIIISLKPYSFEILTN